MLTDPESLHVEAVSGFYCFIGVLLVLELDEAVAPVERDAQDLSVGLKQLHYVLSDQLVRGEVADENACVHHLWVVAARVTTLAVVDLSNLRFFSRHAAIAERTTQFTHVQHVASMRRKKTKQPPKPYNQESSIILLTHHFALQSKIKSGSPKYWACA